MFKKSILLVAGLVTMGLCLRFVFASDINYNDSTNLPVSLSGPTMSNPILTGNAGLGTTTAQTTLAVLGNVGLGTWTASGGKFVLKGGGNVGIGTPLPGKTLDVFGDARLSNGGKYYGDGSALSNLISVGSGGWTNNGTNIYKTTATNNVGLGTTTPQAAFVVANGNMGLGTWTAAGGRLIVRSGNVGVGSVNANHELEIIGSMALTGVVLGQGAAPATSAFSFATSTNTGLYDPGDLRWAAGGVAQFRSAGTADFFKTNIYIGDLTTDSLNNVTVAQNVGIGTNGSSAYYMTAAPLGGMIVEGNVGIGTLNPQTKLTVLGNVGVGTWTAGGALVINGGGNVGISTAWPGQPVDLNGGVRVSGVNDLYFGDDNQVSVSALLPTGGDQVFTTNNAETMRITSGGNLGIGTVTPLAEISMIGNLGIGSVSYSNYLTTATANGGVLIEGNVGIGTWLPTYPMYILSSVAGYSVIGVGKIQTNTADTGVYFDDSSSGGAYYVGPAAVATAYSALLNGNVGITTTTPQGSLVVLSGNVGIGTWAPRAKLVVQGGNVGIGTANANYNLQIGGCTAKTGTTSCVDIAELIPSSQEVESGDVVMLDARSTVMVMKAVHASNHLLFGAVTTDPAIVIEGASVGILNGKGFQLQPKKPAVALKGRIPVKVNLDNGPIHIGDMITASSVPGIGVRAVQAGKVIGMALESLEDLGGKAYQKILVYINPQWWVSTQEQENINRQLQQLHDINRQLERRIQSLENK